MAPKFYWEKSYLYKFGGISRKEDNFAKYTGNLLTETFLPRFPDFSLGWMHCLLFGNSTISGFSLKLPGNFHMESAYYVYR